MGQRLLDYTVLERSSYHGSKVTRLYCTRKLMVIKSDRWYLLIQPLIIPAS